MRILLVSPESPVHGGGGIATYIEHAIRAHVLHGHTVRLLIWTSDPEARPDFSVVEERAVKVIRVDGTAIWRRHPNGPYNLAFSHFLTEHVLAEIESFGPDVIETTDYLSPLHNFLMRRQAGNLPRFAQEIPVVVYNHGLLWEVNRADATIPAMQAHAELTAERDQLRWADAVFVPSHAALAKLTRQVNYRSASVLPEPFFWPAASANAPKNCGRYVALGRVSIAKGLDRMIHFLNVVRPLRQIDEILFVGSLHATSFRYNDPSSYIEKRLHPELRSKLVLTGALQKEEAIRRCTGGGFGLSFSQSETYNYSFLELLSAGLLPLTNTDTAMAEFFPESWRHALIPYSFTTADIKPVVAAIEYDSDGYYESVSDFARTISDPSSFASNYRKLVNSIEPRTKNDRENKKTGSDVTILMATHNETGHIDAALQSALNQTVPAHEIILVDDGSTSEDALQKLDAIEATGKVRVLRSDANEGLCATRIKLVAACRTDLAVFLDADDLLDETYIQKTLDSYNTSSDAPNAVTTWRQNFDGSNEEIIRFNWNDQSLLITNDLRMTSLIEVEALRKVGFDPSMRNGEADDWDFWLRFREHGLRLVCYPETLFRYRFAEGSMSWPWSEGQAALTADLIAKRMHKAVRDGASDAIFVDLLQQLNWGGSAHKYTDRMRYIQQIKEKHPITHNVLRTIVRLTTSVAKRLNN